MSGLLKALGTIVSIAAIFPTPFQPYFATAAIILNIAPADLPPKPKAPNVPDLTPPASP